MWILSFLALQFAAIQATNYKLQHEGLNFSSYNKDYIANPNSILFNYNDTSLAYNITITFKRAIPNDLMTGIRIFVFQAKAFRKFPYELDRNVCDTFARNDFGIRRIYEYSNFRGCPMKPNYVYYCNNFIVDDKKIPKNLLIPGKYRVNVKLFNKTVEYGLIQWFVSIVPETH